MPEPTSSLSRDDFRAEIGLFLGYGRGADAGDVAWGSAQEKAIDSCLNSGLHKFYFPPLLPGERAAHVWSFLTPTAELTLESGKGSVPLPADFGGLDGEVVLSSPVGQRCEPVPVVGQGQIDRLRATVDGMTGKPQWCAILPLRGTGRGTGQRFELAVYPTADADCTLRLAYRLAPGVLTAAHPWPYGGPVHRETILESCLAVAESRLDDSLAVHKALFMEQLQASVSHDRQFRPKLVGYNGDGPREGPGAYRYDSRLVTIDGLYST